MMGGFYTDESLLQIVLVTGVIGGGAAWLSGRAIASTWRPLGHVIGYMMLLGAAVRFVHFALFEGTLLSLPSYATDTLYLIAAGSLAWRITQVNQMVRQYNWLYQRASLLAWRERPVKPADVGGTTATPV
jgi:Domain of unknown function (DUF6867)